MSENIEISPDDLAAAVEATGVAVTKAELEKAFAAINRQRCLAMPTGTVYRSDEDGSIMVLVEKDGNRYWRKISLNDETETAETPVGLAIWRTCQ